MKHNLLTRIVMVMTAVMFIVAFAGAAFADEAKKMEMKADPKTKHAESAKASAEPKGLLDGKHFAGEMGKEGATTGDKELITFKRGTFHSTACDANGFTAAPYTATEAAGVVNFSATCTSPKMGTLEWSGTVKGDELNATATLAAQEGKEPMTMWAKCTKAKMEHMEHKGTGEMKKTGATTKTTGGK